MELHAYTRTISDLFSVKRKYVVPRFQREYSWTKEQVFELWDDILSNINIKNKSEIFHNEYFIGSLVLVGDDKSTRHLIVDGQQRLTTITILLSVLCDRFLELKKKNLAESIYDNYISGKDDNGESYFKLENETPKPFFQTRIQHITKDTSVIVKTNEELTLLSSYNDLYNYTSESSLNEYFKNKINIVPYEDKLKAIRDQVVKYLKVIFITVAEEDEAYTIFETLNARGMNLSFVDLIKNTLFKSLNSKHPDDSAKTKWKEIRKIINSREEVGTLETFMRHWWLSRYSYVSAGKLYQSFKTHWKKGNIDAKNFIADLCIDSKLYIIISSPVSEDFKQQEDRNIFNSLKSLKTFGVIQHRPFLLSLFKCREKKLINHKRLISTLNAIESFHFIFNAVCSMRASGIDGTYSKAARDLHLCKTSNNACVVVDELVLKLKERLPEKELFVENFSKLQFLNGYTKDKKIIQYIFHCFEKKSLETSEFEPSNITLEHIVPQNTGYKYVGMIGNILPLSADLNQQADDKSVNDKIMIYKKSLFETTKNFADSFSGKWGKKEIEDRTLQLASHGYDKIWEII